MSTRAEGGPCTPARDRLSRVRPGEPRVRRFCNACGSKLEGLPPGDREERKVVTVLFANLVGFTSLAEHMDPEDVRAVLRGYHGRLQLELERFGGTVEKFIGDAVMAVFGAPRSHEDDPERAVRAALAICDWVNDEQSEDRPLQVPPGRNFRTGRTGANRPSPRLDGSVAARESGRRPLWVAQAWGPTVTVPTVSVGLASMTTPTSSTSSSSWRRCAAVSSRSGSTVIARLRPERRWCHTPPTTPLTSSTA